tara:strand:+ start:11289 stop:12332 length:1044 start_codon:yes stop_codon:yes gene_type:complete
MTVAFITGINGQDGSYLAEFLLDKGYKVYGIIRRSSSCNTSRIDHIFNRLTLSYGDVTDGGSLVNILNRINKENPETNCVEIYNLAAMSHVKVSFEIPEYTANGSGTSVLTLLEAIRLSNIKDKVKFYQASTSELYGKVQSVPQNEQTPFYPRSPYGVAKLYGYWITVNYRESYNMFACNGILFNHESPRRGQTFVTRKITKGLSKIIRGEADSLILGNLDARRDWGHAKDYVKGMWKVLQASEPSDYVLSTNEFHTVREFVEKAFALRGFAIKWKGAGINEIGYDTNTGKELIFVSEKYFRPAEVEQLLGDSSKAKKDLNWIPEYSFTQLVEDMVNADCPNYDNPD